MRLVNAFDRGLGVLIITGNSLGSAWIFVMTLMIVADILMRKLFNAPINGITELVTMSVVAVLYLQLAYTLRAGNMTRSDAVLKRLIANRPRLGYAISILFSGAGIYLMGVIMMGAWPKWLKAYEHDFYVGIVGVFTFPDWPRLLIVFIGCGLTGLQFFVYAAIDVRALFQPRAAHAQS
jgi:TRAP-type mannitol/chloroaromatic compound transport system permease small subunit